MAYKNESYFELARQMLVRTTIAIGSTIISLVCLVQFAAWASHRTVSACLIAMLLFTVAVSTAAVIGNYLSYCLRLVSAHSAWRRWSRISTHILRS